MTLEETIKKMLNEASDATEKPTTRVPMDTEGMTTDAKNAEVMKGKDKAKKPATVADTTSATETENMSEEKMACSDDDTVETDPKLKKKDAKKDMKKMSEEVDALLETEGLSEDFKLKASTIFEAAVAERAMQIEEEVEQKFTELFEAEKAELISNIDGFLNEAVQTWIAQNEVAIQANFRSQVTESFMDGLAKLLAEHNVDVPEEAEDAFEVALDTVEELEEELVAKDEALAQLQEEVAALKASAILESFKSKMADSEFDRFSQLVESISFKDADQYTKQLNIVLENFALGSSKAAETAITESVEVKASETKVLDESVAQYAQFLTSGKRQSF